MLSWLPVVCPVGRPMAGYRAPAAPTRYLSTRNTLIDGGDEGDDGIEERIFSDHHWCLRGLLRAL